MVHASYSFFWQNFDILPWYFSQQYTNNQNMWLGENLTTSFFLKLQKIGLSQSLAVKTTYLTHKLSYLNPEGEVSSFKIG